MNCFQIIIFVSPETTMFWYFSKETPLWIAFKLLFLCRQKQLVAVLKNGRIVVNCFQIIIFVSPETTVKERHTTTICCELLSNYYFCVARNNNFYFPLFRYLLWIAFKLLFLCRQKQQRTTAAARWCSCELLSNYYFCVARNNQYFFIIPRQ